MSTSNFVVANNVDLKNFFVNTNIWKNIPIFYYFLNFDKNNAGSSFSSNGNASDLALSFVKYIGNHSREAACVELISVFCDKGFLLDNRGNKVIYQLDQNYLNVLKAPKTGANVEYFKFQRAITDVSNLKEFEKFLDTYLLVTSSSAVFATCKGIYFGKLGDMQGFSAMLSDFNFETMTLVKFFDFFTKCKRMNVDFHKLFS